MYFLVAVFSFGLYAAADGAVVPKCDPEAKDQVAWEMIKALTKDFFYLFETTNNQTQNCTFFAVNETDEKNHTGTLRAGIGMNTSATAVALDEKGFPMMLEEGCYRVLYTDNSTCGVVASPGDKEIFLWVAQKTAVQISFHHCCGKVFQSAVKKKLELEQSCGSPEETKTYRRFFDYCLGPSC
ncbi:uncharacterized protein LOC135375847 [Ornithodoros turicata]|uniref:uncharacterized protein LOC135375847 n=1 Tax=Ornithodoros turicata TaxID=34597 RepID=UPI003139338C